MIQCRIYFRLDARVLLMVVTVVTRSNFSSLLPSILHHIKDADFIAFDTELTGLTTGPQSKYFYYDDIRDRYRKLRDSGTSFGMLQIGLSAFKHKKSGNGDKYTTTSWSFHLFPSVSTGGNDYRRWTVQLSAISFLREHGFDFNKTFLDGISYLSLREEADLRAKQGQISKSDKEINMKEEDKMFLKEAMENVRAWISQGHSEPLVFPACNSFQRLLLYQYLPKEFGEALIVKKATDANGDTCVSVVLHNVEERKKALDDEIAEFEKNIVEQIGFRRIFDFILAQKKPLVGHNCWLDLCHIYQKFIGPLPLDWNGFKEVFAKHFNAPLLDTKFLATHLVGRSLLTVPGTSLEQLATCADDPSVWGVKVRVDGGKTKNQGKQSFHDAGFDAHCTGKVLVGVASILAKENSKSLPESLATLMEQELSNRIFMMQSDVESVVLAGPGEQSYPDRDHLHVLTDLAFSVGASQVLDAAVKLGAERSKTMLYWADSRTVYIACEGFTPSAATVTLETADGDVTLRCMSYSSWKQIAEETPSKRPRPNHS
ncbi:hypothetical protein PSACC_00610 [Paramicrosporidium saccamoebae]|uniref:Uncharacterized protein n=1 Tax=Paramicrosporidium saccamoebae TaxID=1246581 RepID=A0A2H9TPA4_9FUNG|nr:hypothetical protein PSACC_00610 [Paramicrosporidium saccamoebae]